MAQGWQNVQNWGDGFSTASRHTYTPANAVAAGALLAVALMTWNNATVVALSDSVNGSWSLAASTSVSSANFYIYYKENSGAGTPTVTIDISASIYQTAVLGEFSGVNTSSPLRAIAKSTGTSNIASSGNATSSANELVIGLIGFLAADTSTGGDTYAIAPNTIAGRSMFGTNSGYMVHLTQANAAGSTAVAATFGSSMSWGAIAASFAAASGGGSGSGGMPPIHDGVRDP